MALLEPALSLVPWGHTLLVCTLLLLLVVFRLTLGSMKLVLPLNCISYLTVDLPGFTPSSRPQIKNLPPEAVMPLSAARAPVPCPNWSKLGTKGGEEPLLPLPGPGVAPVLGSVVLQAMGLGELPAAQPQGSASSSRGAEGFGERLSPSGDAVLGLGSGGILCLGSWDLALAAVFLLLDPRMCFSWRRCLCGVCWPLCPAAASSLTCSPALGGSMDFTVPP